MADETDAWKPELATVTVVLHGGRHETVTCETTRVPGLVIAPLLDLRDTPQALPGPLTGFWELVHVPSGLPLLPFSSWSTPEGEPGVLRIAADLLARDGLDWLGYDADSRDETFRQSAAEAYAKAQQEWMWHNDDDDEFGGSQGSEVDRG